jgi:trimethylamine--corrinoid protein Co-methyltransferase
MSVPWSGAQYVHYAFGLLERTNMFCPEQAVMDDAHIGIIKWALSDPDISKDRREGVLTMVREVMETDHKTYIYHLPLPTREPVYIRYPLEDQEGDALLAAHRRYHEIMALPRHPLPKEIQEEMLYKVSGILPKTLNS